MTTVGSTGQFIPSVVLLSTVLSQVSVIGGTQSELVPLLVPVVLLSTALPQVSETGAGVVGVQLSLFVEAIVLAVLLSAPKSHVPDVCTVVFVFVLESVVLVLGSLFALMLVKLALVSVCVLVSIMRLVLEVEVQRTSLKVAIMSLALRCTLLSHVSEIGAVSASCFRSSRFEITPGSVVLSLITLSNIVGLLVILSRRVYSLPSVSESVDCMSFSLLDTLLSSATPFSSSFVLPSLLSLFVSSDVSFVSHVSSSVSSFVDSSVVSFLSHLSSVVWSLVVWSLVVWSLVVWSLVVWSLVVWSLVVWSLVVWSLVVWSSLESPLSSLESPLSSLESPLSSLESPLSSLESPL